MATLPSFNPRVGVPESAGGYRSQSIMPGLARAGAELGQVADQFLALKEQAADIEVKKNLVADANDGTRLLSDFQTGVATDIAEAHKTAKTSEEFQATMTEKMKERNDALHENLSALRMPESRTRFLTQAQSDTNRASLKVMEVSNARFLDEQVSQIAPSLKTLEEEAIGAATVDDRNLALGRLNNYIDSVSGTLISHEAAEQLRIKTNRGVLTGTVELAISRNPGQAADIVFGPMGAGLTAIEQQKAMDYARGRLNIEREENRKLSEDEQRLRMKTQQSAEDDYWKRIHVGKESVEGVLAEMQTDARISPEKFAQFSTIARGSVQLPPSDPLAFQRAKFGAETGIDPDTGDAIGSYDTWVRKIDHLNPADTIALSGEAIKQNERRDERDENKKWREEDREFRRTSRIEEAQRRRTGEYASKLAREFNERRALIGDAVSKDEIYAFERERNGALIEFQGRIMTGEDPATVYTDVADRMRAAHDAFMMGKITTFLAGIPSRGRADKIDSWDKYREAVASGRITPWDDRTYRAYAERYFAEETAKRVEAAQTVEATKQAKLAAERKLVEETYQYTRTDIE